MLMNLLAALNEPEADDGFILNKCLLVGKVTKKHQNSRVHAYLNHLPHLILWNCNTPMLI